MTTVAVIGAGPAGLVAAKSCLEEGLDVTVFEKSGQVGGLWRAGMDNAAWEGMRTNLSRWSCMFSDFPWPEGTDDFPTQKDMVGYLKDYANHFGITERIRFSRGVELTERADGYWKVNTRKSFEDYDKLIIASGFFSSPKMPDIKGQYRFKGQVLHSAQFNNAEDFRDKKVVVVGGSFSGYEIASELAKAGIDVTHTMKSSAWVLPRYIDKIPNDLVFYSRDDKPAPVRTRFEANRLTAHFFESSFGNPKEAHPDLAIDKGTGAPNFVTISDNYLSYVRKGSIGIAKGFITEVERGGLVLDDGTRLQADVIIYGTGYKTSLDYMAGDVLDKLQFDRKDSFLPLSLHQTIWPEKVEDLAFVGFYRGPFFGTMELQARNVAAVMAGRIALPDPEKIKDGIQKAFAVKAMQPRNQFPYPDYMGLSDELARNLGIAVENVSPIIPSIYRLNGPHAKPDIAQKVIASLPKARLD